MHYAKARTILVAEDVDDDYFLIARAFNKIGSRVTPRRVASGEEVIDYLSEKNAFADRAKNPLPELVILDVRLPGKSGFEVLAWIRRQSESRALPVVFLSSSESPEDVNRAYALGANSYLMKPGSQNEYELLLRLVEEYWIDWNRPPMA